MDGRKDAEKLIEKVKSQLSDSRTSGQSSEDFATLLRYTRLLYKLEKAIQEQPSKEEDLARFYREKAFHILDWMPALMGIAGQSVLVNTLLQAGMSLQKAAACETTPACQMADEKIALELYFMADQIVERATPDVAQYAYVQGLKALLAFQYADEEFREVIAAFQHKSIHLAGIFPFVQPLQSNIAFVAQEDQAIVLMRQLLHALIRIIDDAKAKEERISITARCASFIKPSRPVSKIGTKRTTTQETEKTVRKRLMQEMLVEKEWTENDLTYNLNAPWSLQNLDEAGWTQPQQDNSHW